MRFGAREGGVEVVRDGRVEHLALVQREDVEGEVVEERVGDEEVDSVALAELISSHLLGKRKQKGHAERM